MASDALPAPALMMAQAIEQATGIDADELSDIAIVYMTTADQIGVLTYACCASHAVTMLSEGAAIVHHSPIPDLHIPNN